MTPDTDVTQALLDYSAGDREALERVLPQVYDHLRNIARRQLRAERTDHTLTPTALVHEAYLKLVQLERITWRGVPMARRTSTSECASPECRAAAPTLNIVSGSQRTSVAASNSRIRVS